MHIHVHVRVAMKWLLIKRGRFLLLSMGWSGDLSISKKNRQGGMPVSLCWGVVIFYSCSIDSYLDIIPCFGEVQFGVKRSERAILIRSSGFDVVYGWRLQHAIIIMIERFLASLSSSLVQYGFSAERGVEACLLYLVCLVTCCVRTIIVSYTTLLIVGSKLIIDCYLHCNPCTYLWPTIDPTIVPTQCCWVVSRNVNYSPRVWLLDTQIGKRGVCATNSVCSVTHARPTSV